jgi:nucleoside 2-deoxyribosyltransferase
MTYSRSELTSKSTEKAFLRGFYRQIELADIVIADMTGQNPNVFYEVGYAHAKGKLCILLTSDAADIPFDLKHQRHIVYGKSIVSAAICGKKSIGREGSLKSSIRAT